MQYKKYRWSRDYESAEEELNTILTTRYPGAERWEAEAFADTPLASSHNDLKLWCAEGSLICTINGQRISVQPGDALDIPAETQSSAQAGISGCVCYQYTTTD